MVTNIAHLVRFSMKQDYLPLSPQLNLQSESINRIAGVSIMYTSPSSPGEPPFLYTSPSSLSPPLANLCFSFFIWSLWSSVKQTESRSVDGRSLTPLRSQIYLLLISVSWHLKYNPGFQWANCTSYTFYWHTCSKWGLWLNTTQWHPTSSNWNM